MLNRLILSHQKTEGAPEQGAESVTDIKEPSQFKVIMLNDDFTPMDFVIYVLKTFFLHSDVEAEKLMLQIHHEGSAIAGIYTFEVAEIKSHSVNQFSKNNKYPLKTIIEEVEE